MFYHIFLPVISCLKVFVSLYSPCSFPRLQCVPLCCGRQHEIQTRPSLSAHWAMWFRNQSLSISARSKNQASASRGEGADKWDRIMASPIMYGVPGFFTGWLFSCCGSFPKISHSLFLFVDIYLITWENESLETSHTDLGTDSMKVTFVFIFNLTLNWKIKIKISFGHPKISKSPKHKSPEKHKKHSNKKLIAVWLRDVKEYWILKHKIWTHFKILISNRNHQFGMKVQDNSGIMFDSKTTIPRKYKEVKAYYVLVLLGGK